MPIGLGQIVLYSLLILLIFSVNTFTFSYLKEKRIEKKVLEITEKRYTNRREKSEKIYLEEGYVAKIGFLDKLDILIERSGLRKVIPFATSEIFIFFMLLVSILGYFVSKAFIYDFWIINLGISILILIGFYLFLYITSGKTYEKIDNILLLYINNLENFSGSINDIITLFERVIPYTKEPLKQYTEDFVNEAKSGNIKLAFRNFEKKIENRRFKNIIKNLEISSRHEANYEEVLKEARKTLKGYFGAKEDNKSTAKNGRVEIIMILFMGFIVMFIMKGFAPNLLFDLKSTPTGNYLIGFTMFLFLLIIWNFIKIDKN